MPTLKDIQLIARGPGEEAEGAAGLPVFAVGAGPAVLLGPTGGYLFGFIPAVYITGRLAEKGWDRRIGTTVLAMVFGNLAILSFGLLRTNKGIEYAIEFGGACAARPAIDCTIIYTGLVP